MPLESRPPAAKVFRIGADPEGKAGRRPWKATARPSVSAPGSALGSVLTGALSSVQVESHCTARVNVMRAPSA